MSYITKLAVNWLCKELRNDPEYYRSWKANIAMAFKDVVYERCVRDKVELNDEENQELHDCANTAAKRFLDLLIRRR